jgi:hypothetical protein
VAARFDPEAQYENLVKAWALAICEGHRSRTREYFAGKFGRADTSIHSLNGERLQEIALGLRVKSTLPDPVSVLLTVAQNRYLLNSLRGKGFLNEGALSMLQYRHKSRAWEAELPTLFLRQSARSVRDES